MNKEEKTGKYTLTFETTEEGYKYIRSMVVHYTRLTSDIIHADTDWLYKNDPTYRKMYTHKKNVSNELIDYANKHNK